MEHQWDPSFPFIISTKPITPEPVATSEWFRLILNRNGSLRLSTLTGSRTYAGKFILLFHPGNANIIRTSPSRGFGEIRFSDEFVEEIDVRCWDDRFLSSLKTAKEQSEIVYVELDQNATERVSRLFRELEEEFTDERDGYRTVVRLKLIELMVMIFRGTRSRISQNKEPKAAWALEDVIQYVQGNYSQEFNLQDLALRCGLNRSYFSRAFKEATGIPLFEYINRIRIQKACLMLKRGNLQITEIAFAVGYNNLSFFYRYFSKIMKMTPREYRAIAQK